MGRKIFGQDASLLDAMVSNVVSWFVRTFCPQLLPRLLPYIPEEAKPSTAATAPSDATNDVAPTKCVVIGRPGGVEQLRLITLEPGYCTAGYNVLPESNNNNDDDKKKQQEQATGPFRKMDDLPADCIIVQIHAFSVNYADICIRWGLYESANEYVGYPMVPGFDIAGTVERVGRDVTDVQVGDAVFGCTLFGAYSTRVMVPALQVRKVPPSWTMVQAASLPTVALTALYALFLAGHFPTASQFHNRSILIHSAAGGVGGMLVQMSKLLQLHPIVGVVGRTHKVEAAKQLGCDTVVDKQTSSSRLWERIGQAAGSSAGYATIMDSSGVETLSRSYANLGMTGRLIVFGFHTNLPMGSGMLSPFQWIRMAYKMMHMPTLNVMEMGTANKAVLAFNLSFFANEREMLSGLFDKVLEWVEQDKLQCPRIVEMPLEEVAEAHCLISTGTTVGKIVLTTTTSTASTSTAQ